LQKIYKLKFSNFSATNYVHKLISIIFSFNFQPTKYVLKTLFYKSLKIDLLNCNGYWIHQATSTTDDLRKTTQSNRCEEVDGKSGLLGMILGHYTFKVALEGSTKL